MSRIMLIWILGIPPPGMAPDLVTYNKKKYNNKTLWKLFSCSLTTDISSNYVIRMNIVVHSRDIIKIYEWINYKGAFFRIKYSYNKNID